MMITFKILLQEILDTQKIQQLAKEVDIDISPYDMKQLQMGIEVEREHDAGDNTDVVNSESDLLKIAVAHLKELPDYYTRLKAMENE